MTEQLSSSEAAAKEVDCSFVPTLEADPVTVSTDSAIVRIPGEVDKQTTRTISARGDHKLC